MSKKPKPRTLGAEPLEERLPISSSAAGVLFGFGLTQNEPGVERSATPGYEASQAVHTKSVAQQPTPIDLTLDLQLDALAVDLVHSEETLLDTISSASDDPFVLTPLTPSATLSDTDDDALRELGDELLLYQISTLDFTQVSFEPVTPQWEPVSHDFGDALTPPEDLTVYGYSPAANGVKKNDDGGGPQMSCCGPPSRVECISISGCGATLTYYNNGCTAAFNYSDARFYTTNSGISLSWGSTGCGSLTVRDSKGVVINTNNSNSLLVAGTGTLYSNTYTWNPPAGTPKSQEENVFAFEFTADDTVTAYVHFGYAEVQVAFAGRGDFHQCSAGTPKTLQNTVVVGQQVHAKLVYDTTFTRSTSAWLPSGGPIVKDYQVSNNAGVITTHGGSDYTALDFIYYYTDRSAATNYIGNIKNDLLMVDPHGYPHYVYTGVSFNLEAAKVVPWGTPPKHFDYNWTRTVGVFSDGNPPIYFLYTGLLELYTCVEAPIYGDGEIAFTQLINTTETRDVAPKNRNSNNVPVLDGSHIYGAQSGNPAKSSIKAGDIEPIYMEDAPNTILTPTYIGAATKYSRKDDYTFYVIYKPNGTSIWVTLASGTWGWEGAVTKTGSVWTLDAGSGKTKVPTFTQPVSTLPTWEANVSSLVWK